MRRQSIFYLCFLNLIAILNTEAQVQFGPAKIIFEYPVIEDGVTFIRAVDIDNDGDTDLFFTGFSQDKIYGLINEGQGDFDTPAFVISDAVNLPESIAAIDIDGDGKLDLISASEIDDKVAWYENLGDNTFGSQRVITSSFNGAQSVDGGDIDQDGDNDILVSAVWANKISWFKNNGIGEFSEVFVDTRQKTAYLSMLRDLDNDADLDIIFISTTDQKVAWYENLENGVFSDQKLIGMVLAPGDLNIADINNDGLLDVLTTNYIDIDQGSEVVYFVNLGDGEFGSIQKIGPVPGFANTVESGDFDDDGDLDIFSSNNDYSVIYFDNDKTADRFNASIISDTIDFPIDTEVADMDGDGDLDLIVAFLNFGKVTWFENMGNLTSSVGNIDRLKSSNIQIFPNPSKEEVNLNINQNIRNKNLLGLVLDPLGKRVKLIPNLAKDNFKIDVSKLNNGFYSLIILSAEDQSVIAITQLVVQ